MAKVRTPLGALLVCLAVAAWKIHPATPEAELHPPHGPVRGEEARSEASPAQRSSALRAANEAAAKQLPGESSPWDPLRERVRGLESADQAALDRLYQDASERIREDEPRALHALEQSYRSLLDSRLEEGFFVVSAWMRASHAPAHVLRVIWSQAPQGADVQAQASHFSSMTPADRHRRIEAYALRELRKLVEARKITLEPEERKVLIAELTDHAGGARSLNVGLEAFQLLETLNAQGAIESALERRTPEERELIAKVLDPNT